ncbi:MAG: histidine phosphatase family protein, partial [Phycisphaerales bacterium]|nr:histidine phosphatase family protein [Phycisphaerales bacterium]
MNGNSITINPAKPTEVFLLLHERANRPSELEFEYMTGKLRDQLEERRYGPALAEEGVARAERLGTCFKGAKVKRIFTDSFVTALETAKAVARAAGLDPATQVTHDMRIRESDLSYLSKARFTELGALEQGENPNATLRDWMDSCPNDFRSLVSAHLSLWNDLMIKEAGNSFAMVLHVEGVLLLT